MSAREFCYWLQGFFELGKAQNGLSHDQTRLVQKHLALVFKHEIDPSQGDAEHQAALNKIHGGGTPRC